MLAREAGSGRAGSFKTAMVSGLFIAASASPTVSAQDQPYAPDIEIFDGTSTFQFETDSAFRPKDSFTVEFWLATSWQVDPGYDPVILSSGSISDPEFTMAVLTDRDGFEFSVNAQEIYVAHDLANEKLHHIAAVWSEGEMALIANGEVAGVFPAKAPSIESELFWIGSAFGEGMTYIGSIGQVRFWDAPLDVETLRTFALSDVSAVSSEHPYLESLRAMSAFDEDALLIIDGLFE